MLWGIGFVSGGADIAQMRTTIVSSPKVGHDLRNGPSKFEDNDF
jgi:hypothetical protein